MHSKDMLSNKKHDTTSWDHVVQLQGSSHDIQEWQEKKQYEEQHTHTYICMSIQYICIIFSQQPSSIYKNTTFHIYLDK